MVEDTAPAQLPAAETASGNDPVASLAAQVRHAGTGTLARLRRFHPQLAPHAALFDTERLLLAARVHARDAIEHARWALVLHCLALAQGRHDTRFDADPGAVLARLRFGEARLRQLVEADDRVLASLMPRLARRLAAAGASINWWPLADLLLYTGSRTPEAASRADTARQRLIRRYLDAAAQDSQASQQAGAA